jgi:hypothetical protein
MLNSGYPSDLVRRRFLSSVSGVVVHPCVVGRRSSLLVGSCFLLAIQGFAFQEQRMAPFTEGSNYNDNMWLNRW